MPVVASIEADRCLITRKNGRFWGHSNIKDFHTHRQTVRWSKMALLGVSS